MGALTRLQRGLGHLDLTVKHGLVGTVVDTGVGVGASYLLGQVHGRFRDVEYIEHLPLAVSVLGKLGAVVGSALAGGGSGWLTGVADSVGQAGLNAHFLSWGIEHGMSASGRKLLVLPKGKVPAGLPAGRDTVLGEIPPPAAGRYLDRDRVANLARNL